MTATEARTEPTYEPAWPLDKLTPASDNPRRDLGDLTELAESIAGVGIVEPLVATTTASTAEDGHLLLVCGHRRHAAAAKAGLSHVPVVVHQGLDDSARVEAMITENVARSNLLPTEEAAAYEQLVGLGRKQRDIAKKLGVSQPHVSRRMALLKLPEKAREAVDTGSIRIEDAVTLAALPAEQVADLFKRGVAPRTYEIDALRHQYERQQSIAKERAELQKAGVAFIERPPGGFDEDKGPAPLSMIGYDRQIDMVAHRSEPCHAVVDNGDKGLTHVCTEPSRHPVLTEEGLDDAPEPKLSPEDTARREERRRRDAEEEAQLERIQAHAEDRRAFCRELVNRPCANDIIALALEAVFYLSDMPPVSEAAALLGLEVDEDDESHDFYGGPQIAALRTFAAQDGAPGSRTTHQALYAVALAAGEGACPSGAYRIRKKPEPECELPMARAYLEHLWAKGFERHEIDEAWVNDPADPDDLIVDGLVDTLEELRARVIRNACLQTEDEGEQAAIAETLREADQEFLEDALEQFPDPVDEPGATTETELAEVTIRQGGKGGKKYIVICTGCREELSSNSTTLAFAEDVRQGHLEVVHGAVPPADAAAS